jgi:hypothetical protein
MGDPLDDLIRRTVNAVPVPPRLEARVRATLARRRMVRFLGAAAALLLVCLAFWLRRPPVTPPPDVVVTGPRVVLADSLRPMELRDVQFAATLHATEDGISIRFEGARDE